MGLDMYLYKIPKVDRVDDSTNKIDYDLVSDKSEIAYWRKFNALHNWLGDNAQGGEDECNPHIVNPELIQKLIDLLKSLSPENCNDLFPTSSGFFFGSTEYNELYWNDVTETIDVLEKLSFDPDTEDLVYLSSW